MRIQGAILTHIAPMECPPHPGSSQSQASGVQRRCSASSLTRDASHSGNFKGKGLALSKSAASTASPALKVVGNHRDVPLFPSFPPFLFRLFSLSLKI